jgi:8-oxo-dGTP pyrophosphatase MutT (NUDIX family)
MRFKRETARAILITPDGKICLMKRIKNGEEYWVTPGGGLEEGENPLQTLIREVKEEIGAHLSEDKCTPAFSYIADQQRHHFFVCYEDGYRSIPEGDEHRLDDPNNTYHVRDLSVAEAKNVNLRPLEKRDEIIFYLEKAVG